MGEHHCVRRRVAVLAACLVASVVPAAVVHAHAATPTPPRIGHEWTIMLENSELPETLAVGQRAAPYLTRSLPRQGKLVVNYFGTGHSSLDNYIAMVSGQGPNASTQEACGFQNPVPHRVNSLPSGRQRKTLPPSPPPE